MTFALDVSRWIKKTKLAPDVVVRKLALDAYTGILKRSPVLTGRFRASHRLSIGKVDLSTEAPRASVSSGGSGPRPATGTDVSAALSKLTRAQFGTTIHITNALPYARPLENGSSRQTNRQPNGIYGATFEELRNNLQRAIKAARNGS
jgi:hypothetical protein